jgi:hypothetical protein
MRVILPQRQLSPATDMPAALACSALAITGCEQLQQKASIRAGG